MVIGFAGFIAGGVIAVGVLDALNFDSSVLALIAFIVGGIIGVVLLAALFDYALIGLSSLAGAVTLSSVFVQRGALAPIVIVVLFIIGVVIQTGWLWNERRSVQRGRS
jgi:hypothetical protein